MMTLTNRQANSTWKLFQNMKKDDVKSVVRDLANTWKLTYDMKILICFTVCLNVKVSQSQKKVKFTNYS